MCRIGSIIRTHSGDDVPHPSFTVTAIQLANNEKKSVQINTQAINTIYHSFKPYRCSPRAFFNHKRAFYSSGPNSGVSMPSSLQSYSQSYSRSNISQSKTIQPSKDQHNGLEYQTLFPYFNSSTSFIFRVWCNNFRHPLWPYLHQCPTTHPSLPSLSSV
jgi:hypothetical protein